MVIFFQALLPLLLCTNLNPFTPEVRNRNWNPIGFQTEPGQIV